MAKTGAKKKPNKIVIAVIIAVLGILAIVAVAFMGRILKMRSDAQQLVNGVNEDTFKQTQSSIIYDTNGAEISTLSGIKEMYYLDTDQIPMLLKRTFVQIEDQEFYSHRGIDMVAIIRATIANAQNSSIVQGASTITQQLSKLMFLNSDVTWNRKITEMFLAFELEERFTKDQILEFYINNVYFANGYYGIEAAAHGYFGCPTSELTVSELAFLAGIPNNPNKYDPITNYAKAIERRNSVLMQIYAAGIISSLDYYTALESDIVLSTSEEHRYNYVETYVFYCATRALMEANGFVIRYEFEDDEDKANYQELYDAYYKEYQQSLFHGGYRIYTSIDMTKQQRLQEILDDKLKDFTDLGDEGIYKMQGAGVCIDNNTGLVVAIVGGRSQEYDGYTLNRAYQSYRQPGSSIKPLLDYAPYMEAGHMPSDLVDDSPIPSGPVNFSGLYRGLITLKQALCVSSNVVAWKICDELTPEYCMNYLHKMNYSRIGMDDHFPAVAIGGFTYGATPVEMAAGYETLENDGKYRKPSCIAHIDRADGTTIVAQNKDETTVYDETAARKVTKMLSEGVDEGLVYNAKIENAIVAAKTGSTNDNKDGWTVGYSRYYTTAIWCGMDMPETVEDLYGSSYPMEIWKAYMNEIHNGLKKLPFPDYAGEPTEEETTANGDEESQSKPHQSHPSGGNLNYENGDFNHDVDVDHMGDQDVDLNY